MEMLTTGEISKIRREAGHDARLGLLSHIIGNDYIDAYEMRDIIDMYSVTPQELREYTFKYYDDDDNVKDYFKELFEEMGLLCQECEHELDDESLCSNTECDSCDDSYLSEEQLEERYKES